jgi:hypothetical protein
MRLWSNRKIIEVWVKLAAPVALTMFICRGVLGGAEVPDKYIVELKLDPLDIRPTSLNSPPRPFTVRGRSVASVTAELAEKHGFTVTEVYEYAVGGFAATIPPGRLAEVVRDDYVKRVEPDTLLLLDDPR